MLPKQTTLYALQLPEFLVQFKDHSIAAVLPKLLMLKQIVRSDGIEVSKSNPFVLALVALFLIYALISVYRGLFHKQQISQIVVQNTAMNSNEMIRELTALKKQLKTVQTSFNELSNQLTQLCAQKTARSKNRESKNVKKVKPKHEKDSLSSQGGQNLGNLWAQFAPIYSNSMQGNKNIAGYILQAQQQIFRELRKLKKSKLQTGSAKASTVRSKTSAKKSLGEETKENKQDLVVKSIIKEKVKRPPSPKKSAKSQIKPLNYHHETDKQKKIEQKNDDQLATQNQDQPAVKNINGQIKQDEHIEISSTMAVEKAQTQWVEKGEQKTGIAENSVSQQREKNQDRKIGQEKQPTHEQNPDDFKQNVSGLPGSAHSASKVPQESQEAQEKSQITFVPKIPPKINVRNPQKMGGRKVPPPPPRR